MQSLSLTHPEIDANLLNGRFFCQIGSKNTFGKIPMDQTIEETINKDTQTAGFTKGFNTKTNAATKYYMTANDRASYVRQLRPMMSNKNYKFTHLDMTKGRITRDERDVKSLYNMLMETWKNPFEFTSEIMCCISTGVIPSDEASADMCDAKGKGESVCQQFITERLEERSISFFSTIPNLKLKSFKKKRVKAKTSTGKEIILKADKNLFYIMTIVAQSQQLGMKGVFSNPLGKVPWSLSTAINYRWFFEKNK